MTQLHVVPSGDQLEDHRLVNCPCQPRPKLIPREDGTVDTIHLHRSLDPAEAIA